ncbi:hypothetical protein [Lysinibacillus sp. NPDC086135]|uniref:hypothetical protein n=1 Tax=Lysinibacillus sp. NPDC086135 TaxID=3364130 RepID=UPI00381382F0
MDLKSKTNIVAMNSFEMLPKMGLFCFSFQQVFWKRKQASTTEVSPISLGGEMNAVLRSFLAGVQTSAEIEELSLRTPRPVAIFL